MRLVIVYNANAGLLAGAMDSLHKLFVVNIFANLL